MYSRQQIGADFRRLGVAPGDVVMLHASVRAVGEVSGDAGVHPNWPARFFAQIVDGYPADSDNRGGRVGDARSDLFPARGLVNFARPMMERTARGA